MRRIEDILSENIVLAVKNLFNQTISPGQITLQKTKQEFEGDITLLVFPLTSRVLGTKKSPEETANAIGKYLKENVAEVKSFNVVKGFLNLVISHSYWANYLSQLATGDSLLASSQQPAASNETVMVEFSSPNTNKPLHLGHMRNILLGVSVSEILKAAGKKVIRVNLVNDRGIHISKSMLAWKKWGNGETPESSGMKGDHLVGKYYVMFDQELKKEKSPSSSQKKEHSPANSLPSVRTELRTPYSIVGELEGAAQEMLRKWEAGDKETIDLWKKMNGWVYDGFAITYKNLGVEFEKTYYESETYLLGKKIVQEGLSKGVFKKKEDGSVWVDLTADGLDEKLLLRADGTSVYITQDLGTVMQRLQDFKDYKVNKLIYVVGNEQDYHFKVLFLIIKKLIEQNIAGFGSLSLPADRQGFGESGERGGAASFFHLSYGMVDLPSGKMKSREGTVVDADDLIDEMIQTAKTKTQELGKADELSEEEADKLYKMIGFSALKYFILKVDPKKRMLFNPEESIDFNGNTGPFIQYTYARIKSVLRKAGNNTQYPILNTQYSILNTQYSIHSKEKSVLKLIHDFPKVISESAETYNPGHIANYVYELAKEYNQFYQEIPILKAEKEEEKNFRLLLSEKTAETIKFALQLMGIEVPEKM